MTRTMRMLTVGVMISVLFVVVGVVWLSNSAETLDNVAEHLGASESPVWNPPISDYEMPGLEGNMVANIAVGLVSTLVTLGAAFTVGKCLRSKRKV